MFRTIQATTSIGEGRRYWRSRFWAEMPQMMIPRSTVALFTSLPFHDESNPGSRGMNY